jgi:hypothetical protein
MRHSPLSFHILARAGESILARTFLPGSRFQLHPSLLEILLEGGHLLTPWQ